MPQKRACDCCIARKISGDMAYTFLTPRLKRGLRRLRSRTMANIRRQGEGDKEIPPSDTHGTVNITQARDQIHRRIQLHRLVPVVEVYRLKLYPIWPVVAIDDLNHVLDDAKDKQNPALYVLVLSLCAATMARLKLPPCDPEAPDGGISGDVLANEAIRARMEYNYMEAVDEHSVMASFFLHCYFSNMRDRQGTSFHTYIKYTEKLAQRIRILYFCDFFLLAGFLNLVQIFIGPEKIFFDNWKDHRNLPYSHNFLVHLQNLLGSMHATFTAVNESQKVDVIVTHCWMQVLLWQALIIQASLNRVQNTNTPLTIPANVAQILLTTSSQVSRESFEVHGPGMTIKVLHISNALADLVICMNSSLHVAHWKHLLRDLSNLLFSLPCHDGKARDTLMLKLATALQVNEPDIPRAIESLPDDSKIDDANDQLVVQQHTGDLGDGQLWDPALVHGTTLWCL
ncbi:hypothetical protein V1515DRAFT_617716 [Lipomyces mesembrius]